MFGDVVNDFVEKAKTADGFVFGSPVYYLIPERPAVSFFSKAFLLPSVPMAFFFLHLLSPNKVKKDVENTIKYWLIEYRENRGFVRFSIDDKKTGKSAVRAPPP